MLAAPDFQSAGTVPLPAAVHSVETGIDQVGRPPEALAVF